jgi:hypothetical protein
MYVVTIIRCCNSLPGAILSNTVGGDRWLSKHLITINDGKVFHVYYSLLACSKYLPCSYDGFSSSSARGG